MKKLLVLLSLMSAHGAFASDGIQLEGGQAQALFESFPATGESEVLLQSYLVEYRRKPGILCEHITDQLHNASVEYSCTIKKVALPVSK